MSLVMGLGTTLQVSSAGSNLLIWDTGAWDLQNWASGSGEGDASLLINGLFGFVMSDGSTVNIENGPIVMNAGAMTMTFDIASVSPNGELLANFAVSEAASFEASFTDLSFVDATGGSITAWAWTFGDGGTSTLQNPTHIYGAAGTYTITLTVTDTNSNTSTATLGIIVNPGGNLLVWDALTSGNWDQFSWS
jgi:PKD repeat protein